MTKLVVSKIDNLNTIILRQKDGRDFFIATDNSLVISVPTLSYIISFLVENEYFSSKILEGILEEYNSLKGDSIDRINPPSG